VSPGYIPWGSKGPILEMEIWVDSCGRVECPEGKSWGDCTGGGQCGLLGGVGENTECPERQNVPLEGVGETPLWEVSVSWRDEWGRLYRGSIVCYAGRHWEKTPWWRGRMPH
jgi:hypothetical protein